MESEGIKPIEAFKKLSEALSETDAIAGHNILGFDIYMIKGMYEKMGRKMPSILEKKRIFDTLAFSKGYFNNIPIQKNENEICYQYKMISNIIKGSKTSLSKVAENFNIEYDQGMLHDALYDLNLNLKVWNKLKYQIDI
jgi:DNA polymerase III epsilon subunit-like protein